MHDVASRRDGKDIWHQLEKIVIYKRDIEKSCKIKNISSQILTARGQKGAPEAWSVGANGPPAL
jgi:hypothetical protein